MNYQFAHVYTYSQSGGKKGGFKVSGCLGEAFRDDGFTSHIEKPDKEIGLLYGSRGDVEKAVEAYQEGFKDSRGHKLRKDGKSLLAGVFSWPPGTKKEAFEAGNKVLLEYLQKEYGPALRCVLTHEDEPFLRGDHKGETHFHIHFHVVPEPDQSMKELHPGLKAKADARADGKNVFDQDQAYKWAMGDWQDKINREVGARLGLIRLGPKEKRLSRREQKVLDDAEKKAQGIKETAVKEAESIIEYGKTAVKQNAGILAVREKEIAEREKQQDKREREFEAGRSIVTGNMDKKFNLPGIANGEHIKVPLVGDVLKWSYFEKVKNWAVGLVKELKKLMEENQELNTELKNNVKISNELVKRLDGKYGEAKEFEAWKTAKNAQRIAQERKQEKSQGRHL